MPANIPVIRYKITYTITHIRTYTNESEAYTIKMYTQPNKLLQIPSDQLGSRATEIVTVSYKIME